jgi:hypothetical protein
MASTCLGGSLSSIGQSIKLNEGGAGSKAASSWGRSWSIGSDDAYRAVDTIKLEDEAFSYKGALTGRETDCSKRY